MPAGGGFAFGPYLIETRSKRLLRDGELVELSPRQFDLLHALVSSAGEVLSKDLLIKVGWPDVIVGDSSLEKMISHLRQHLDPDDARRYIKTVARQGYQFVAAVTRIDPVEAEVDPALLLAPHRAWIEGRAALETLTRDEIARARAIFEPLVRQYPGEATFHVGLANAYVIQFEATRADPKPDVDLLRLAVAHAHQASRLRSDYAEAWATLGFVLERTGERLDGVAALERAVKLAPHNWLHFCRLSAASWGTARLDAAGRTLTLCPHLPMAHLLAATVFVARDAPDQAEREIDQGLAIVAAESTAPSRFSTVGLHWLKGLLCLRRGAVEEALTALDRELALEPRGHFYARECCANTSYVKGVVHLRRGDRDAARIAFGEAIARVQGHPMAHAGLVILDGLDNPSAASRANVGGTTLWSDAERATTLVVERALARAAVLVWAGDVHGAVDIVAAALAAAPPGNAGWLIPIEPLLGVQNAREAWAPVLATLHLRAR